MFSNQIILGFVQGVAEWLPISSEGLLFLVQVRLFEGQMRVTEMLQQALFLHLGTFLAASVYFWRDVVGLTKAIFSYRQAPLEKRKVGQFLLVTTLVSGLLGLFFLKIISQTEKQLAISGRVMTLAIGLLLLGTGIFQLKSKSQSKRGIRDLSLSDGLFLGLAQGLAVLPGLSRSGLTVSGLLLRGFEKSVALKMSFLMSLPIVLVGNIFLNLQYLTLNSAFLGSLLSAFIFGMMTIHLLLKLAEKLNFGFFVTFFGMLVVISVLV
jgi:undecaprenyl-diphosphatase